MKKMNNMDEDLDKRTNEQYRTETGIRVKLNLTKSTYMLLTDVDKVVKETLGIKFCYADIKCRLKIKWVDESIDDEFFLSMEELQEILGNH